MVRNCWSLLVLLTALSSTPLLALDPVVLVDSKEEYRLGGHLKILEDRQKEWTIEDVSSAALSGTFVDSRSNTPNFGYTQSAYWISFSLRNDSSANEWLLEVGYPLLDSVELYVPTREAGDRVDTSYTVKKAGDTLPFGEREIADQNFLFILPVGPEKEQTLYLRVETEGSMQVPLTIMSYRYYIEKDHNERTASGLYYGIILGQELSLLCNLHCRLRTHDALPGGASL